MSPAEQSVLAIFRMYLATPGRMLCLHGDDLDKFDAPLASMTQRGWLTEERYRGGYSLTEAGYAVMKAAARN